MSYYKKLNLDLNPLISTESFRNEMNILMLLGGRRILGFGVFDPRRYIKSSVLDAIEQLGVRVKDLIVFNNNRNPDSTAIEKRALHKDISWNSATESWQQVYCGINWEISAGSKNLFSWYDTSMLMDVPPPRGPYGPISAALDGIHVVYRGYNGVPFNAVKLDETYIDMPTLVRTDVAHITVYGGDKNRYAISLRIDETDIHSWQQVEELFLPLGIV